MITLLKRLCCLVIGHDVTFSAKHGGVHRISLCKRCGKKLVVSKRTIPPNTKYINIEHTPLGYVVKIVEKSPTKKITSYFNTSDAFYHDLGVAIKYAVWLGKLNKLEIKYDHKLLKWSES